MPMARFPLPTLNSWISDSTVQCPSLLGSWLMMVLVFVNSTLIILVWLVALTVRVYASWNMVIPPTSIRHNIVTKTHLYTWQRIRMPKLVLKTKTSKMATHLRLETSLRQQHAMKVVKGKVDLISIWSSVREEISVEKLGMAQTVPNTLKINITRTPIENTTGSYVPNIGNIISSRCRVVTMHNSSACAISFVNSNTRKRMENHNIAIAELGIPLKITENTIILTVNSSITLRMEPVPKHSIFVSWLMLQVLCKDTLRNALIPWIKSSQRQKRKIQSCLWNLLLLAIEIIQWETQRSLRIYLIQQTQERNNYWL